ncbi:MAG: hypothetical protein ACI81R_002221 [Bradymonadia bacterium]|jgi:hypothetical protein
MTRTDYERALADLQRGATPPPEGYNNTRCERCRSSLFCDACVECHRCTHCTRCEQCSHATHCVDCANVHDSSYCERSTRCIGSQYLIECVDCERCTYCYGCVGLSSAEFHILNVKYDRKTYFDMVAALGG